MSCSHPPRPEDVRKLTPPPPERMHRRIAVALAVLALAAVPGKTPAQSAGACPLRDLRPGDSLAVVLSGGGAHGIAHIGVLEVLDSLGVRPVIVAGTSMGALVGALYAGGMSGRQLDSLVRHL